MKELNKRILGNEILLAEEYRPEEFTSMNITPNSSDILMQDIGNLLSIVEIEVEAHESPSRDSRFLILFNNLQISSECLVSILGQCVFFVNNCRFSSLLSVLSPLR